MDSLVIERSLAILEDRYRGLRKIGEQQFESFEGELAAFRGELEVVREGAELCLLQLNQAQEELNHYSLRLRAAQEGHQLLPEECALKDVKLRWLRR